MSSQALDEGFIPNEEQGSEIFYRTKDWDRYKVFKGHSTGTSNINQQRYERHAKEIGKILDGSKKVLSLGGGTGSLESKLVELHPKIEFAVSDIYERKNCDKRLTYPIIDMTKLESVIADLKGVDTIMIINALSPLKRAELEKVFQILGESEVNKIIIYSAEDIRALGLLIYQFKQLIMRRRSFWIGYLYSYKFITKIVESTGFKKVFTVRPNERGFLTPVWGSVYLSVFSRNITYLNNSNICVQNLHM